MTDIRHKPSASFRPAAALTLAGQIAYVVVTQLHAGGHANDHDEIFETYAHNALWGGVHLGQFMAMTVMIAGLIALALSLPGRSETVRNLARFGAAAATATLGLYGALQAVDGVALKQAVTAWTNAPEAEQAARFAAAESIRWLEWGMRSYQDYALGVSLLALGAAVALAGAMPRLLASLIVLSGVSYLAQGWIAGSEGFSATQSIAIVAGWALTLAWASWLAVYRPRPRGQDVAQPAHLSDAATAHAA
jgi:hypothetical protein